MDNKCRILYVARMKDDTYRTVEAVSWDDARRYFGHNALSVLKCAVSVDRFHQSIVDPNPCIHSRDY